MPSLSEEEMKDVDERIAKFKAGHDKLVEECQVDVAAFPMWVPSQSGVYQTIVRMDFADLKYRNPSPIAVS